MNRLEVACQRSIYGKVQLCFVGIIVGIEQQHGCEGA
jgi:hypothetical protein